MADFITSLLVQATLLGMLLLAPTFWLLGRPGRHPLAVALLLAAVPITFCSGSSFLFAAAVSTCLTTIVCTAARIRVGPTRVAAALLAMIGGVLSFWPAWKHLVLVDELRRKYPIASVVERLEYEDATAAPHAVEQLELAAEVEQHLGQFEGRGNRGRAWVLQRLHSDSYRQFVLQDGFGVVRMIRVSRRGVELPPVETAPFPDPPQLPPDYPTPDIAADRTPQSVTDFDVPDSDPASFRTSPASETLVALHDYGLQDFLNADSFGYVRGRDHVVGFEPHQFRQPVNLSGFVTPSVAEEWQVTRLELVSLLKHEAPCVYASEHLPRMDELADAPTRPLDGFELRSLPRLRSDEDVVIDERTNEIRMLGSLRAGKDCLECHRARRGELLGAFTYTLHRRTPINQYEGNHATVVH